MNEVTTIQDRAREAASWFEYAGRTDERDEYIRTREGRPEWVQELVWAAHGNGALLPDDYRYRWTLEALEAIAELDETADLGDATHDFADSVDVYNAALLAWLSSNLNRIGYVDEWLEEAGAEGIGSQGVMGAVMAGQYREREEVFGLVVDALAE